MLSRYRTHLLIALLAFGCAQGWNRWNIAVMRVSPEAAAFVRPGGSILTPDDASYLQAVEKLLGHRPDMQNAAAAQRPILRPPGYGLWYGLARLALPPDAAIAALLLFQGLLFAFGVALLHEALMAHRIAPAIRIPLLIALAVLPTFHGFLFHTLSEGVTPALALILLCTALLASAGRRYWLFAGCFIWSLLIVTRPVLAWAGMALIPALVQQSRNLLRVAAVIVLCALPTALWWTSNCLRAGRMVGLHPVYQPDDPGINRPTHAAFWNLAKSWGASGSDFHFAMETAFRAALHGDTGVVHAERFIAMAPSGSLTYTQRAALLDAHRSWQRFNCLQLASAMASAQGTIRSTTDAEQAIIQQLNAVTAEWRSQHFFHHHVLVPLRVLKQLVAHSNLNLYVFQHRWRGHPAMEVLRWSSAILHVLLLCAVPLALLLRVPPEVRWTAAGACAYLLYLAYVQRGVEERYTLPVLFIGVVCMALVLAGEAHCFTIARNDGRGERELPKKTMGRRGAENPMRTS
jgi:hypothetical protein